MLGEQKEEQRAEEGSEEVAPEAGGGPGSLEAKEGCLAQEWEAGRAGGGWRGLLAWKTQEGLGNQRASGGKVQIWFGVGE